MDEGGNPVVRPSSPYLSAFLIVRDAQILADKLDKIIREGSPLLVRTLFGRFT